MDRNLIKRSVRIDLRHTSVALEREFWAVLEAIAGQRGYSMAKLVQFVASQSPATPVASALRVFALTQQHVAQPTQQPLGLTKAAA
jgi:predicted DNA-binding ribbon-helix-helix protein